MEDILEDLMDFTIPPFELDGIKFLTNQHFQDIHIEKKINILKKQQISIKFEFGKFRYEIENNEILKKMES